jgi:hypothetical protein
MNTQTMKQKNIRNCVDEMLIQSSTFMWASERLEQHFNNSVTAIEPLGIAVVGESRSGKSRVIDALMLNHKEDRTQEGLRVPILKVTTPAKPTVKGFVDEMLYAIGDRVRTGRETEITKTERLKLLMKQAGTTLLVIEEFQHFYDRGSRKVQHHLSDFLKNLLEDTKIFLVVVGLPTSINVINQNEQLSGRMLGSIKMQRYNWSNKDSQHEFVRILKGFESGLRDFKLPAIGNENIAFRFFCASGGLIGYIVKILKQAVWDAIEEDRTEITMRHLEEAFSKAIWLEGVSFAHNPFASSFDPTPTKALMDQVARIGLSAADLESLRMRELNAKGALLMPKGGL